MDVNEGCYRAFAANQLMMRSLLERRKDKSSSSNRSNCDTIRRTRKSIQQVYRELGPNMFRRSFRMEYSTFSLLFAKIKPQLVRTMGRNRRKKRKHAVNGLIPLASRLGCAIRYWAGADPYDLMLVFGISYTEVHTSGHRQTRSTSAFIDKIINSKQSLDEMNFLFPTRSVPGWGRTD